MTRPDATDPSGTRRRAAAMCAVSACLLMAAAHWPRPVDGAHVLAVQTVPAKSHWYFMRGVLRALADRGHRVTVYTPFPDRAAAAHGNYTEVDTLSEYGDQVIVGMDLTTVATLARPLFMVPFMGKTSRFICDIMDGLRLSDAGPYDVFIAEPASCECVSVAARRLGVPLVYTVPAPLQPWVETAAFGHHVNPAYVPHVLSAYSVLDTFYRRLHNVGLHVCTVYLHHLYVTVAAAVQPKHYDLEPPVKPSLVFVNTHYATEPSRPVPVNRVDVAGIHLKRPKPLPKDILEFIEGAPHGVILFTFGTVVAISTLPDHIQKAFKDALAEVPQRILLKHEGEMTDKPENVMTRKWLPQRDILVHPNVKLFICHGGISGVYETVDAGVPVLGFPLFYDQPRNIANLVDAGMAISLDLMSVDKDTLLNAINTIINDETYSRNAKITSERFKDRPMSPAESVVYWTEYVIRHKGAPHLKSQAFNLTWYQYYLLDVFAAVLSTVFIALYVIYKMSKCFYRCVFKPSPKPKSKRE
ncbi:UDP-glucuronosyltransferase 2C1-like [Sipha flava]|uniref:UDP-glucuronosyltransferase n=1 Tax=Sipha flava TaxID=143950 RepID=A0A2S2PXG3_9HEMI|nr:UDP-glucuronosyltransferase 2C1-like [Sipha flava]